MYVSPPVPSFAQRFRCRGNTRDVFQIFHHFLVEKCDLTTFFKWSFLCILLWNFRSLGMVIAVKQLEFVFLLTIIHLLICFGVFSKTYFILKPVSKRQTIQLNTQIVFVVFLQQVAASWVPNAEEWQPHKCQIRQGNFLASRSQQTSLSFGLTEV